MTKHSPDFFKSLTNSGTRRLRLSIYHSVARPAHEIGAGLGCVKVVPAHDGNLQRRGWIKPLANSHNISVLKVWTNCSCETVALGSLVVIVSSDLFSSSS